MTGDDARETGNPYVPHTDAERAAMLDAVGAPSVDALFDLPAALRHDGEFGIDAGSERAVRDSVGDTLDANADVVSFLGRGHYDHYVPAVVDALADRPEFLTSYTQYQPEATQGYLQALFEYQSLVVELTGLAVANATLYDAATALGEAALLADRVGGAGDRVLVPETLRPERLSVLETYAAGPGLAVDTYPTVDGTADVDGLAGALDDDASLVYAETPSVRGCIEPELGALGDLAAEHGALFAVGADPVSLALLERPADVGADVVVGDAASLGLGASYGTGAGLFATREAYRRQVPGRLVGASEDATGRRAYTLTLQTREQHIRRERATSNVCTNQAHLALRAAIHAAWLGPDGLVGLAEDCVTEARALAARLDDVDGFAAPADDRHHFREFVARTDRPASEVAGDLLERGYAVHAVDEREIQVCVAGRSGAERDGLVAACREVGQ